MTERVLPATVVASHLDACAAELAAGTVPTGELAEVLDRLVSGQRQISLALDRLAGRLEAAELLALSEVLRAAASASGHAADALAASEHLVESMPDDTHL